SFCASSLPARAEVVTTRLAQTATALREDFGAEIRIDVVRMAQVKLTNTSGLAAAGFQRCVRLAMRNEHQSGWRSHLLLRHMTDRLLGKFPVGQLSVMTAC